MALKKIRNGPVIEVDPQIIRWRKKIKKYGINILPKGTARTRKLARDKEYHEIKKILAKKDFF